MSFQEVLPVAMITENRARPVVGLCFHSIERKLLSIGSILHVHVEEEEWEVVSRYAMKGKSAKLSA